jgi:hypothetical protein
MVPWTSRLLRHSKLVLATGTAVAMATIGLWAYLPHEYNSQAKVTVPAGHSAIVGTTTWTLKRISTTRVLSQRYEPQGQSAVDGATFVVADIETDLSGYDPKEPCGVDLIAGEYRFTTMFGYEPPDSTTSICGSGPRLSVAYEVPDRILPQIDGVVLQVGDKQPRLLLGHP